MKKINLENIKGFIGKEIKNYRELCSILEIEEKGGNSKKAQLAEVNRFVKMHKEGRKFIVEDVYEKPLLKKESKRNTVYKDMMQILIMDYLIQLRENYNRETVVNTRNVLMEEMNIVNKNYRKNNYKIPDFSKSSGIELSQVYDFYNTTNSNFRAIIERALEDLRNKSLIIYDKVTSVKLNDGTYRKASGSEKEYILLCEYGSLESFGYRSINQIRNSPMWEKFKKDVEEQLHEYTDIDFYFQSYEITMNTENIVKEQEIMAEYYIGKDVRANTQKELNNTLSDRLLKNAEKRHSKSINNTNNKEDKFVKGVFSYISNYKKMIKLLIETKDNDNGDNTSSDDLENKIEVREGGNEQK